LALISTASLATTVGLSTLPGLSATVDDSYCLAYSTNGLSEGTPVVYTGYSEDSNNGPLYQVNYNDGTKTIFVPEDALGDCI
jgi:hypothetical protein